jgi:hypothetical protein
MRTLLLSLLPALSLLAADYDVLITNARIADGEMTGQTLVGSLKFEA